MDSERVPEAFDMMSDEELALVLVRPFDSDDHGQLPYALWMNRPSTAERVIARVLRTTSDRRAAAFVASGHGGYG